MYNNTLSFSNEIQLGDLNSGIYLVNVSDGNKKEIRKMIIN